MHPLQALDWLKGIGISQERMVARQHYSIPHIILGAASEIPRDTCDFGG